MNKYILRALKGVIGLLIATLLILLFVLYTNLGARWTIAYVTDQVVGLDIETDAIEGSLAQGLSIESVYFSDENIEIKVTDIQYQVGSYAIFSPHIQLTELTVNTVSLYTKSQHSDADVSSDINIPVLFNSPIVLPLTVRLDRVSIAHVFLANDSNDPQEFSQIQASLEVEKSTIAIKQLIVEHQNITLTTSGQLQLIKHLPLDLSTHVESTIAEDEWAIHGALKGALNELSVVQSGNISTPSMTLDGVQVKGLLHLVGKPKFDMSFNTAAVGLEVFKNSEHLSGVESVKFEAKGSLERYSLDASMELLQHNNLKILMGAHGSGNTKSAFVDSVTLNSGDFKLDSSYQINWEQGLVINGDLAFEQLGVSRLIRDEQLEQIFLHPELEQITSVKLAQEATKTARNLNGKLAFRVYPRNQNEDFSQVYENSILTIDAFTIGGVWNGEAITATLEGYASSDELSLNQFMLTIGKAYAKGSGNYKNNNVDLTFTTEIPNAEKLYQASSGKISAKVALVGSLENPLMDIELTGERLAYNASANQKTSIESLTLTAKGQIKNSLQVALDSTGIYLHKEKVDIPRFELQASGNLSNHAIKAHIQFEPPNEELERINTDIQLAGKYDESSHQWQGSVNKHNLDIESTLGLGAHKSWRLETPMKVLIGDISSISKGCWMAVNTTSKLCLQGIAESEVGRYQAQYELAGVDLELLLPVVGGHIGEKLDISGYLTGFGEVELSKASLKVDTELSLTSGVMGYLRGTSDEYIADITTATLVASHSDKGSVADFKLGLDDGSSANAHATIVFDASESIVINADFDGEFIRTEYITELTSEIEDIQGELKFSGALHAVKQQANWIAPELEFEVSMPTGYIVVTRTGTTLESLTAQLATQKTADTNRKYYSVKASGRSKDGMIELNGELNVDNQTVGSSADGRNWDLIATAKGSNFRLLTLPEIELEISPNVDIVANQKSMDIRGEVSIPFGSVVFDSAPEAMKTSSDDIVIHESSKSKMDSNRAPYGINYDVTTIIESTVSLDVLGLQSGLKGQLQVKNDEDQINGYGVLELHEGTYEIYGQKLNVDKGKLIFNGAIDSPSLEVLATRQSNSGDVVAGIKIGGTPDTLQSSLYSTPSLRDIEILSYIVTGSGLDEESTTSLEQLGQVAILLGLNKGSSVFSYIQSKLGIDVLTIKEGRQAEQSQVEAGKNINDKLYLGYSHGLFNRTGFWLLKYKLSKAFKLESKYGSEQSIDLIYSIQRK